MQPQSITLNFIEGSSAKTYQCQLEPAGDLWVVNFQYGRIGASLSAGTKTATPIGYEAARKVYDKLVGEKRAKGYTEHGSGIAYTGTDKAGRVSGALPMLLNPITEEEMDALILDPAWCCEVKQDGERRMADATGDAITGINRKGLTVALAAPIAKAVEAGGFDGGLTRLDGEDMGDVLMVFDVLSFEGRDLTGEAYSTRLKVREEVYARAPQLGRVITATTASDKRRMVDEARERNEEGIVFKRLDAPYTAGRPNSGGNARKFKFVESATVRVASINPGKRSVGMEVMDDATAVWTFVGNVTIPPSAQIPAVGDVVECRYLYYFRRGSLFQPVYVGPRPDQDSSDCVLSQLKVKADPARAAA